MRACSLHGSDSVGRFGTACKVLYLVRFCAPPRGSEVFFREFPGSGYALLSRRNDHLVAQRVPGHAAGCVTREPEVSAVQSSLVYCKASSYNHLDAILIISSVLGCGLGRSRLQLGLCLSLFERSQGTSSVHVHPGFSRIHHEHHPAPR